MRQGVDVRAMTAAAASMPHGGASVAGGGGMVGAGCDPRPERRPMMYITRNALYEPSTADINVSQEPLYLTSLYVFLSASATGTSPFRVRVWDTMKSTSSAVAVTSDVLMWQSTEILAGGVFFWEPATVSMDSNVVAPNAYGQIFPLGPRFSSGLRVQVVDEGNSYAVLAASTLRVFATYIAGP